MACAYAPYSGYAVGAAVRTSRGDVFCGCNVENASYGLTMCAERNALAAAVAAGQPRVCALAVTARGPAWPLPCGACRQVLAEFAAPRTPVMIARAGSRAAPRVYTLEELLPHRFRLA